MGWGTVAPDPLARMLRSALLLVLCLPCAAQSTQDAPANQDATATKDDRGLDNFRRYLERSPYHDRVFDQLVRRLRSQGELASFLEELGAGPQEPAHLILRARLHAEHGEIERALDLIAQVDASDPRRLRLSAEFRARAGDRSGARADLEAAVAAADPELAAELYEDLAGAQLAAGDRGAALESFEHWAELRPDDPLARMDVGDRLARAGFHRAASDQFQRVIALTEADPARRCDAQAALGQQYEHLSEHQAAIDVYLATLPQLRRGHWLAEELRRRLLDLFERGGRLAELVTLSEHEVTSAAGDAGAREFLALVLERAGHADDALEVLAEAVLRFPDDPVLSQLRRDLARRSGDADAEIAELQRLLAQRPRDVELAFALGEALAQAGRFEAAAQRWGQLVGQRSRDASLARRLAVRWVQHRQPERARTEYERARDLEPQEVDHHVDLARFLVRNGAAEEAFAALNAAEVLFAEQPRGLVVLGEAWQPLRRLEDAARCLRKALDQLPDDAQLRFRLGVLLLELGEIDEARAHLRGTASRAREWELASLAAWRYVGSLKDDTLRAAVLRTERLRRDEEPKDRGAHLVGIALERQAREDLNVRKGWERLIADRPEDVLARLELATWLGETKRYRDALAVYDAALEILPRRAREILLAQADLYGKLSESDAAVRCLDRLVDLEADDPEVLTEVALRLGELQQLSRALATWERVLRLRPDDGEAHLAAARVAKDLWRVEVTLEHLRNAWRDRRLREPATALMVEVLGDGGHLETEVAGLDARVRADPFDQEATLLVADLLAVAKRPADALERIETSLALRPYARELLERKGKLCLLVGRSEDALEAFALLRQGPGASANWITREMVVAHLAGDMRGRAIQLACELPDPTEALDLFEGDPSRPARIRILRAAASRPAPEPELLERLARECEQGEEWLEALGALETLRETSVTGWKTTRRIGILRHKLEDAEGAVREGARLLTEAEKPDDARAYFEEIGDLPSFFELTTLTLLATPGDEQKVREVMEMLHREGQRRVMVDLARRLRTKAIEGRAHPAGYTLEAWARWLHSLEIGTYELCRPEMVAARIEVLREQEAERRLSEKLSVDLIWLLHQQAADVQQEAELIDRILFNFPSSPTVLFAAAEFRLSGGQFEGAAKLFARAATALREPKHAREVRAEEGRRWEQHAIDLRPRLVANPEFDDELVARALRLAFDPDAEEIWSHRVYPDPFELRLRGALAHALAGQVPKARNGFVTLSRELGGDEFARRRRLVGHLAQARIEGIDQEALIALAADVSSVRNDPLLSGTVAASRSVRYLAQAMSSWQRAGRDAEAYLIVRHAGLHIAAREFLFRHRFYERAQEHARASFLEALELLGQTQGLDHERALRRFHDATVVYAEALRAGGPDMSFEDRQKQESDLWDELRGLAPDDLAVLWRAAGRADWAGDWDTAAATHFHGARARAALLAAAPEMVEIWRDQLLTELFPPRDQIGRAAGWQDLRFQSLGRDPLDPTPHWLGALHASLMLQDHARAVEALGELLASDHRLDPESIRAVLEGENYGDQGSAAAELFARWRAEQGPR